MGAIGDAEKLQRVAASELGRSLKGFLGADGPRRPSCEPARAFAPRLVHSEPLEPGPRRRVAVLPFLNRTNRDAAGEVLALHFLAQLAGSDRFEVIDAGVVRSVLLERRILIRGGVSFDEATSLLDVLRADLVLSGEVRDLEQLGAGGLPRVDFTARLIDAERNVVWQSVSQNGGGDAVTLFDFGKVRTASGLACRMAAGVVKAMEAVAPTSVAAADGRRPRRRRSPDAAGAIALPLRPAQRLRARRPPRTSRTPN
jgi:hypothetical protein